MLLLVKRLVATMTLATHGTSALRRMLDAVAGEAPGVTWAEQEHASPKLIGWEAAVRKRHLRLRLRLHLVRCLASAASLDFWATSRVRMLLC